MSIKDEYASGSPSASQQALLGTLQQLDQGGELAVWLLDTSRLGGGLTYWTDCVNELGQPVVWQGQQYMPVTLEGSGFAWAGDGTVPRPQLKIGNVDGAVTALIQSIGGDLVGARVTRTRLKTDYLDAVNFRNGNPLADPNAHFPPELWLITRKIDESWESVQFELGAATDVSGVMIPRGVITSRTCMWTYKGRGCAWAPVDGKRFDVYDQPCSADKDGCSHTLTGCKLRFGEDAVLPARLFPGAAQVGR